NSITNSRSSGQISMNRKEAVLFGLAIILFIVGMGIAVNGYIINGRINQKVYAYPSVYAVEAGSDQSLTGGFGDDVSEDPIDEPRHNNHWVPANEARYIRIPKIGVNSMVKSATVDDSGSVQVPNSVHTVNWYSKSRDFNAGTGASFLVGHVSGRASIGVFYKLHLLEPGDVIEIERGDGQMLNYRVVTKESLPVESVDMNQTMLSVDSGQKGLNIMTCGGEFSSERDEYLERILVRAVQI
ncbi:MAG: class F sortase, partial [Thiothrix sp.]|nr:class F sortase [Thiothrix sp.]